ncbi:MAG TPA: class I SAM-dependent rRNA methyltransferase [Gemmataceae bacterium]|nr:class I SAM-dependent rRNA methyltransferase [Gemmataceae bacterium]
MTLPRVVLLPRRARPFFSRHPWVYPGAIARVEGEPSDGQEVELISHAGNFVARGFFNSQSKLRVRLYSWTPDQALDEGFFRARIDAAVRLRESILSFCGPGQACRLVFSEGDGLPGMTVDRYDQWLVVQFTSLALSERREMLTQILRERLQPRGVVLRTERGIGKLEGLDLQDGPLWGEMPTEPIAIEENGLQFLVDLTEGQKTGFYLDQRDNRRAVAKYAKGRRVLDAFCYSGGFSLYAARAGASVVMGVDGSEPALTLARANAERNGLSNIAFVREDVFNQLDALVDGGERFGMVILDPPKFARARNAVDEALRGYRRLQTQALKLLDADGILVVCCCSGLIDMGMLEDLLAQLAAEERREIQILERCGQAADHPVAVTCLESGYLKCVICRVG